jgi:hypothetical protein
MSFKKPPEGASRSEREAHVKALAAVSISILALLLAVTNYFAGRNSSAVLNGTIASNNLWTWYGTKNVRASMYSIAAEQGGKNADTFDKQATRLKDDMVEIEEKARAAEAARDAAKAKSPYYSYSGMALQLAIVLSSAAILAVTLSLFYASIGVGAVGVLLFLVALGV